MVEPVKPPAKPPVVNAPVIEAKLADRASVSQRQAVAQERTELLGHRHRHLHLRQQALHVKAEAQEGRHRLPSNRQDHAQEVTERPQGEEPALRRVRASHQVAAEQFLDLAPQQRLDALALLERKIVGVRVEQVGVEVEVLDVHLRVGLKFKNKENSYFIILQYELENNDIKLSPERVIF